MRTPVVLALVLGIAGACHRAAEPAAAQPLTVAVVYCGWEIWIGNDQNPKIAADDPSRYPGVLPALKAALEQADLAYTAPPGAQGLLMSYANEVVIRVPRGPLANVTPRALGEQAEYANQQALSLVRGVSTAIDELEKAPAGRRVLIIVSDGVDTYMEQAPAKLAALKQRVTAAHIDVASILYKAEMSAEGDALAALTEHRTRAASAAEVTSDLVAELKRAEGQGEGAAK